MTNNARTRTLASLISAPLLVLGCLQTHAQQKSSRDFYEEAKKADALPALPYVCFRDDDTEPLFEMIGSSNEIADTIKDKNPSMNEADRVKLRQLRASDYLYVAPFDHGVPATAEVLDRKDPNDPSRAAWVVTRKGNDKTLTWEFNINWGTLRFRETYTIESDSLTFYGRCESAREAPPLPAGLSDVPPPCEVPPKKLAANPGVAVLRSGASIRFERKQIVGATTRLYFGDGACGSVIDISTDEIDHFEGVPKPKAPVNKK
jgi:hypothetical protein